MVSVRYHPPGQETAVSERFLVHHLGGDPYEVVLFCVGGTRVAIPLELIEDFLVERKV